MKANEYRERIKAKMQAQADAQNNAIISGNDTERFDLSWLPEYLRPLAETFCEGFGRTALKKERSRWRQTLNDQFQIGLEQSDIKMAMREMLIADLTIKDPGSVTSIAEKHRRKRTAQANDPIARARHEYYERLNQELQNE